MNREFGQRASAGLDLARTPEERQRIIDQLVKDVAGNISADLPLKRKITDAAASLKQRDQELEAAYLVILAASQTGEDSLAHIDYAEKCHPAVRLVADERGMRRFGVF